MGKAKSIPSGDQQAELGESHDFRGRQSRHSAGHDSASVDFVYLDSAIQ